MKRNVVIRTLLVIGCLLVLGALAIGADKLPKFTAEDHKAIDSYYMQELGKLAPGSLDRKGFSPELERGLAAGEKLPGQLEKKLEALPKELADKLNGTPSGYQTYKLGRHVLILRTSDKVVADIIKDAGWVGNGY